MGTTPIMWGLLSAATSITTIMLAIHFTFTGDTDSLILAIASISVSWLATSQIGDEV